MPLRFTKMQAYGNDYVYINAVDQIIEDPNALARRVSERHFGIGSDGMVLICPSNRGEGCLMLITATIPLRTSGPVKLTSFSFRIFKVLA